MNFGPFVTTALIKTLSLTIIYLIVRVINRIVIRPLVKKILMKGGSMMGLDHRTVTLSSILENTLNIVFLFFYFMMVLDAWGISIAPILTGAGVVGLAVGFGAQTLVKDVVTGFFIILENQYNVGDYIKAGGIKGEVIGMNLRTTIIRSDNDITHLIPNSQITTVTKGSKEFID